MTKLIKAVLLAVTVSTALSACIVVPAGRYGHYHEDRGYRR
jgi:hypothetical protein